jgi:hypothetical protein
MVRGLLRRRLHGARRNGRMDVPAAASRPAHEPREKRHGENDRQGSEENAADDAHVSEHIRPRRAGRAC